MKAKWVRISKFMTKKKIDAFLAGRNIIDNKEYKLKKMKSGYAIYKNKNYLSSEIFKKVKRLKKKKHLSRRDIY